MVTRSRNGRPLPYFYTSNIIRNNHTVKYKNAFIRKISELRQFMYKFTCFVYIMQSKLPKSPGFPLAEKAKGPWQPESTRKEPKRLLPGAFQDYRRRKASPVIRRFASPLHSFPHYHAAVCPSNAAPSSSLSPPLPCSRLPFKRCSSLFSIPHCHAAVCPSNAAPPSSLPPLPHSRLPRKRCPAPTPSPGSSPCPAHSAPPESK